MKNLVVLGGGESGTGTALLAKKQGYNVFLSDKSTLKDKYKKELEDAQINFEEGVHTENIILTADEIVKSPGISSEVPIILKAIKKGILIISEIEFAKRYTDAKMICVTGSNGKTTTASLIYYILKFSGLNVGLGGNIGMSFARQVAQKKRDYYVLELSSFQLENMYDFKADIAILLNITPDHLDRYDNDINKYAEAKMRIAQNQNESDSFIFWEDDPLISKAMKSLIPKARKYSFAEHKKTNVTAYSENDVLYIDIPHSSFSINQNMLSLIGTHNLYNTMASSIAAKLLDISDENLREALRTFKGVEHRLEFVAKVRGVQYINDSKATNVNSCWYALKSVVGKIILILGGTDKGNDYTEIEKLVQEKCEGIILLGKDNDKLKSFFELKVPILIDTQSMEDAVQTAYQYAKEDQTVLLSPCCASFDLFDNYEDRGLQFKKYVREL